MAVKRANSQRIGTIPYGSNVAQDRITLVLNEAEQSVIQEIQFMRSHGTTLQQIATYLTVHGIPTKTGKSVRWPHQAIARILNRTGPVKHSIQLE